MAAAAGLAGLAAAPARADDEAGWAAIAALYPVTRAVTQLENGYWGSMATPVLEAYQELGRRMNRDNSWYARRAMQKDIAAVVARVAAEMGGAPEEVALCRNASEGLSALIAQVRDVGAGDRILYADTDYDSTKGDMVSLARARGAEAVRIDLPKFATRETALAAYADAIARTDRLKLVLLTHMSHRTGLVLPIAEIAALARARGAFTIVDAAQSFFQMPFKVGDFGTDAIVVNLHKWVGAPVGTAAFWIRRDAIAAIAPAPATPDAPVDSVGGRVYPGTVDYAAQMAIPAAFDFQPRLGTPAVKLARLQALRNRWVAPLRGLDGLEILSPDDPAAHGALTSFRIRGRTSVADNIAITDALLNRFGIMTVHRVGLAAGACVRVTPSLFTTMAEVDRLVPALRTLVGELAV
ncbi:hypothetical protein IP88_11540 [alpha proteobacterium AAP81b]|nr:hypothetical protein IP88_11540 [alpha proteobacterium AAP81b]